MTPFEQLSYDVTQGARMTWFIGQYLTAARLSRDVIRSIDWPDRKMPDRQEILADVIKLFRRDRENIRRGYYKPPFDQFVSPIAVLKKSGEFFRDLREVNRRRLSAAHQEANDLPGTENLPRYYRQNFHYQSGGYLTEESAELYDYQVEVLFAGSADAMRRQALVPLHLYLKGRDAANTRLLDVGCGTGRFLAFVRDNHPALDVTGVDLSRPYLEEAARTLDDFGGARLREGAAENLPFPDRSYDVLTTVYLFHELPRKVRRQAAEEFARVLKPGGRLIFVDSIQMGDHVPFDPLLEAFPIGYHEPYYLDYARQDLTEMFQAAGLKRAGEARAHLSKVMVFDKPLSS